jgi:hypothetical protein
MTLAVSHYDRGADTVMLDVLREARPPFNPERVVEEFAEILGALPRAGRGRRSIRW